MTRIPNGPLLRITDFAINRCQAAGVAPPYVQEMAAVGFMVAALLIMIHAFEISLAWGIVVAPVLLLTLLHQTLITIPHLRQQAKSWDRISTRMAYRERTRSERRSRLSRFLRPVIATYAFIDVLNMVWLGISDLKFIAVLTTLHAYVIAAVPEEPKPQEDDVRDLATNPV